MKRSLLSLSPRSPAWLIPPALIAACSIGACVCPLAAQDTDESAQEATEVRGETAAAPPIGTSGDDSPLPRLSEPTAVDPGGLSASSGGGETFTLEDLPEDLRPKAKQLTEAFAESRREMAEAVADLRATQLRYRNDVDRSDEAIRLYRIRRDRAREAIDRAYDVALALIRFIPDRDAATFLLTLIQAREATDIYNGETFEGAARLLDGGLKYRYLFHAAARSGLVSGHFETARKIYDSLEADDLEDCDRGLQAQRDLVQRQYEQEMERRERDAQSELPRVRLRTTRGDIIVELFLNEAPSTVSHFLKLVEQDFYDGLDFYQVLDHLLALTGDPLGDGSGNSGEYLADEHDRPDARYPLRGSLVMAKIPDGPDGYIPGSASSQFCILFLPIPRITETQTVFGRVIEGMDAACSFRRVNPNEKKQEGMPSLPPDRVLSAEVIRRPESLPEPVYVEPPEIFAAEQQRRPANVPPR